MKGRQLQLRHDAMEQDCKWMFGYWPCALPDQKNGAMAKASVAIPSIEALTGDRLVRLEKVEYPRLSVHAADTYYASQYTQYLKAL
jgi:hypothetical protein